jgi:hypothetical protein
MISDRSAADICLELVGPIYDCAIDPSLWPQTLRRIADALDCRNGAIFLVDEQAQELLLNISCGLSDEWLARQADHLKEIEERNRSPEVTTLRQDEPFVTSRDLSADQIAKSQYIKEWARPQGLVDAAQLIFLRTVSRHGGIAFGRHERAGTFAGPAIEILRQLAPHLRRSLQISDLLEMRSIQHEVVTTALDRISAAAIIADAGERVVHANEKARKLLDEGITIGLSHNRLTSPDRRAASRLSDALRAATTVGEGSALSYFYDPFAHRRSRDGGGVHRPGRQQATSGRMPGRGIRAHAGGAQRAVVDRGGHVAGRGRITPRDRGIDRAHPRQEPPPQDRRRTAVGAGRAGASPARRRPLTCGPAGTLPSLRSPTIVQAAYAERRMSGEPAKNTLSAGGSCRKNGAPGLVRPFRLDLRLVSDMRERLVHECGELRLMLGAGLGEGLLQLTSHGGRRDSHRLRRSL